jgi:hypothetical protein
MTADVTERMQILCQQISQEQDPEKVLQLVQELNRLLDDHPAGHDLPEMVEEQLKNPAGAPSVKLGLK